MSDVLLKFSNPVFHNFVWYSTVAVAKMMAMSVLTAKNRFRKMVSI